MKSLTIGILLFILCSNPRVCSAQEQTKSIIGISNVISKNKRKNMEQIIEYEVKFFNRIFLNKPHTGVNADVNIFSKYVAYVESQPKIGKITRVSAPGTYSGGTSQVLVCKGNFEKSFIRVCYHELSHSFLAERTLYAPAWLNEGIATYMEEARIKLFSKYITHEIRGYHVSRVKSMITLKTINLKEFVLKCDGESSVQSFPNDSYDIAIAHCMVFLMLENENTAFNIIREICNNKTPTTEAFDMFYVGGFDQFERDFMSRYSV